MLWGIPASLLSNVIVVAVLAFSVIVLTSKAMPEAVTAVVNPPPPPVPPPVDVTVEVIGAGLQRGNLVVDGRGPGHDLTLKQRDGRRELGGARVDRDVVRDPGVLVVERDRERLPCRDLDAARVERDAGGRDRHGAVLGLGALRGGGRRGRGGAGRGRAGDGELEARDASVGAEHEVLIDLVVPGYVHRGPVARFFLRGEVAPRGVLYGDRLELPAGRGRELHAVRSGVVPRHVDGAARVDGHSGAPAGLVLPGPDVGD